MRFELSDKVTALGSQISVGFISIDDRVAGVVHGCRYSHTEAFVKIMMTDANRRFKLLKTVIKDSNFATACMLSVG